MARTVDQAAHRSKREAILDHAAQLIITTGYERMSIQDLIDGLGISRGALYHYFDSKEAVLEALVDRMATDAADALLPIIADQDLSALQKFQRYVSVSTAFKAGRKELISDLLSSWSMEENLRVRHKLSAATLDHTAPMILEPIIRQGIAERSFSTDYPAESARIIAGIWLTLADDLIMLSAGDGPDEMIIERARVRIAATTQGIERILGAPPGSLSIQQVDQLWQLSRARDRAAAARTVDERKE